MEKIKLEPPVNDLAANLIGLQQQISILALAVGCQLKATGHTNPTVAKAIEDNFQMLLDHQDLSTWQEGARQVVDLLVTAMRERSAHD